MENSILGLHHITAIAGDAQRNYDFYTKVLGLRLVKKTVNFDDPGTYHFYFGDKVGTPGTLLTFFPWERIRQGKSGAGMATAVGYSVPENSREFWILRFEQMDVPYEKITRRFGQDILPFRDPDGLNLELVFSAATDNRMPWVTEEVPGEAAIRGFHSVTLLLRSKEATASILTDIFGYEPAGNEGIRFRYRTRAVDTASIVDILEYSEAPSGITAGGTNHHVAFRVRDEQTQAEFREKILKAGLNITEKIDRNYFYSVYFREPGGVLFEIATDNPGFMVDETVDSLGSSLRLPGMYEDDRARIEMVLPQIEV